MLTELLNDFSNLECFLIGLSVGMMLFSGDTIPTEKKDTAARLKAEKKLKNRLTRS